MIGVVIMKPLDSTDDAFQLESQSFRNGPAAGVLGGALNGDPIEFPRIESLGKHRPATGGHDAFALMSRVQPIAEGRPLVGPIDINVVDHPAEAPLEPDAVIVFPPAGVRVLPVGDGFLDVGHRSHGIDPGMPGAQMPAIGVKEVEQFLALPVFDQPQFRLIVNGQQNLWHGREYKTQRRARAGGVALGLPVYRFGPRERERNSVAVRLGEFAKKANARVDKEGDARVGQRPCPSGERPIPGEPPAGAR